jgi:hypothetical protein
MRSALPFTKVFYPFRSGGNSFALLIYQHSITSLPPLLGHLRATDHHNDGEGALGDVEQVRLQQREAELGDDQVREDAETADDQVGGDDQQHDTPDERVKERLDRLMAFILLILDASLVMPYPLNQQPLLVFSKALGTHRVVRQEKSDHDRPDDGHEPEDHEEELPGVDGAVLLVRDSVG